MDHNGEFERVIAAHWADVVRLGLLMFADKTEAEEVAQQTFFKAYNAWESFEGRSSVRTWLFRIAINVCRRNLITQRRFRGEPWERQAEPAQPMADPRDEQAQDNVRLAFARLAPPHRLILTLFCIDGMKHQEIAKIFDVPEGTVWSRLHKAKNELRKAYQAIGE